MIKSNCKDIYNVTKEFYFKQMLFIDLSIHSFHKNKTGVMAENLALMLHFKIYKIENF